MKKLTNTLTGQVHIVREESEYSAEELGYKLPKDPDNPPPWQENRNKLYFLRAAMKETCKRWKVEHYEPPKAAPKPRSPKSEA